MTKRKNDKPFDCVAYKRRVQEDLYERIKDMTPAEEIEFFRNGAETGPFAELVRAIESNKNGHGAKVNPAQAPAPKS